MAGFDIAETSDLSVMETRCWELLASGAKSSKSPMHLVVVGTPQGSIARMRTVVLRRVDIETKRIYFHTDVRSAKTADIEKTGLLSWLAYDGLQRSQLFLSGKTVVHHMDALCRQHWSDTQHFSRRCYLLPEGPGRPLEDSDAYIDEALAGFQYSLEASEKGFEHFAVVETTADRMEWYYTFGRGNKRAEFNYEYGILQSACWLTP